jgi:hypothetical protein
MFNKGNYFLKNVHNSNTVINIYDLSFLKIMRRKKNNQEEEIKY